MKRFVLCLIVILPALPVAASAAGPEITLESLLKEMTDRDAVARFPDPPYKCMQASSYDSMEYAKAPADSPGGMNLYLPIPYAKHCKVTFAINGKAAAKDYDAYSKEPNAWGPVDLGVFGPKDGRVVLRVEVVGANPEAKGTKSYFGLDCVVLSVP